MASTMASPVDSSKLISVMLADSGMSLRIFFSTSSVSCSMEGSGLMSTLLRMVCAMVRGRARSEENSS